MKLKLFITHLFVVSLMIGSFSVAIKQTVALEQKKEAAPVALEYTQTLRRGIKNHHVYMLQKKLKEMGYYTKELDSDYGSGTLAAVTKFQQAHGLKPDGVAGPKTYAKILAKVTGINIDFSDKDKKAQLDELLKKVKEVSKDDYIPAFCTLEYDPVCGQEEINCVKAPCPQSQPKTFGNKCSLNAAGAKYLYSGECSKKKPKEDKEVKACTKEYQPVCGIKKELECSYNDGEKKCKTVYGDKKTFSNKCLMYAAGAEFKYFGKCNTQKEVDKKPDYFQKENEEKIKYLQEKINELQKLLNELKNA